MRSTHMSKFIFCRRLAYSRGSCSNASALDRSDHLRKFFPAQTIRPLQSLLLGQRFGTCSCVKNPQAPCSMPNHTKNLPLSHQFGPSFTNSSGLTATARVEPSMSSKSQTRWVSSTWWICVIKPAKGPLTNDTVSPAFR